MKIKKQKISKVGDPITLIGAKEDHQIRWKKIACKCAQDPKDVIHRHPILDCKHCKFQQQENSLPKKCYEVKSTEKNKTYLVSKVEIIRGKKYDEVCAYLQLLEEKK